MAIRYQMEHLFKVTIVRHQIALHQTTGVQKEIRILTRGNQEQETRTAILTAHQIIVLGHRVLDH